VNSKVRGAGTSRSAFCLTPSTLRRAGSPGAVDRPSDGDDIRTSAATVRRTRQRSLCNRRRRLADGPTCPVLVSISQNRSPLTRAVRVRGKLIHGAPRPTKLSALRSKKLISEHVGHSRADSCWTCLRREPQRTSTDRTQNACSSPSQRKWSTSARMQSSMPPAPGAARTPSEEEHRTSTTQSRCPPLDPGRGVTPP
jgi:hypothetical protein